MMRYLDVARVYASLSGRAAAPLGMPLFFGIFVVAVIVFGPTGMRAADLVFTLRTSPLFAVVLWLGWIILAFPVARLALIPPSSLYLRWLPAPRAILYLSAAICVLFVELPWMVLFGRGEGTLSGFTAGFAALALHAAWSTRPLGIFHGFIFVLWSAAAFVSQSAIAFVAALVGATFAVARAMDRAAEVHAMAPSASTVHHPAVAIALTHTKYVVRREAAVIGRMVIFAILAGMSLPLAARGFDLETPRDFGALSLGLSAAALSPAMSGVSAAVIRSERLLAWLSDVLRVSGTTRIWAAAIATSILGIGGGVCLGLVAMLGLRSSDVSVVLRLALIPVLWALMIGVLFTHWAREADASPKRGDLGMVAALVAMIGGIVSASKWGETAILACLAVAIWAMTFAPQRWQALRRRRGVS